MRKLLFSAIACVALHMTVHAQLCINITGVKPLIERNNHSFSSELCLLGVHGEYVTADALQKALPELAECILAELSSDHSQDVWDALTNLAEIRAATLCSTYRGGISGDDQASELVHSLDALFLLLPDEVAGRVTRAPSLQLTGKGIRQIILAELLPNMQTILDDSCESQSVSDVIVLQLSALEHIDMSICSKLDHLEQAFNQDGSAIAQEKTKTCSIDSQLDSISDDLGSIESSVDFVYTLNSTIDVIDSTLNSVDGTFDAIDENTLSVESVVCIIESKIDVINAQNDTVSIDSTIDAIEDDVCSVDSKVCIIESDLEILNSRLDVVKQGVDELLVGVIIIDSLINP